jgi:hypothetical protein
MCDFCISAEHIGSTIEVLCPYDCVDSRMMMEFDYAWGCVLGFNNSDEFAEVILAFVRGIATE